MAVQCAWCIILPVHQFVTSGQPQQLLLKICITSLSPTDIPATAASSYVIDDSFVLLRPIHLQGHVLQPSSFHILCPQQPQFHCFKWQACHCTVHSEQGKHSQPTKTHYTWSQTWLTNISTQFFLPLHSEHLLTALQRENVKRRASCGDTSCCAKLADPKDIFTIVILLSLLCSVFIASNILSRKKAAWQFCSLLFLKRN